ncbi:hypothetical protein KKA03_05930 [archaeon]|nr:hypothetical protein [archaeon]
MFEEYIPICFAVEKCEKIQGRKKFQKIFYLAKRAGIPIHETFKWNMFGPYSKELASEIDVLCEMELLLEEGFQGGEYSYILTDEGTDFLKTSLSAGEQGAYGRFEKILRRLNELGSLELEKIASIAFLLDEGYEEPYIKKFLEHAKKYSNEEIEVGTKTLLDLFGQFKEL